MSKKSKVMRFMNSTLCVQFGTSRAKASLWDENNALIEAHHAHLSDDHFSAFVARESAASKRVLVSDLHGMPVLSPDVVVRARLISHDDLRVYCDFPDESFYRVGIDRLLYTCAVVQAGLAPCIAVDFGTHTTINHISKAGKLTGGWIVPGLTVWMKTSAAISPQLISQLHHFCFTQHALTPATHTTDALLGGFLQCYQGLLSAVQDALLPVAVTGGSYEMFKQLLPKDSLYDTHWLEKGMLGVV